MTRRSAVLLATLASIGLAGLRFDSLRRLPVHNDERHFALDGMWVHAQLPMATVLRVLLYDHVHPHPFYNPRTHDLGHHGSMKSWTGSAEDDLGPYPRVGHPPLSMIALGALFALSSEEWLLTRDHAVRLARGFNIVLDVATLVLLFDVLRRHFHGALAVGITAAIAAWPYDFVLGSLAYLDTPGSCLAMLAVWYYVVKVRGTSRYVTWALLGVLATASVLVKQTDLVVFPILVSVGLLWRPAVRGRQLLARMLASIAAAALSFVLVCNPVAFYEELRHPSDPAVSPKSLSIARVARQLSFPFQSERHYGFKASSDQPPLVSSPAVVTLYRWSMPIFSGALAAAMAVLLFARRWRALPLIITVIAFVIVVPYGNIPRRLAVIVPSAAVLIAAALVDAGRAVARAAPAIRLSWRSST